MTVPADGADLSRACGRAQEGFTVVEQDDLIAFTDERAAELARITVQTLRRWERAKLVGPTVVRRLSQRNTVRLYGFHDLEALLVVATMRHAGRFSLQHIRKIVERLRRTYDSPLTELRFAYDKRQLYFQHPDGSWEGDRKPDQIVLIQVIELEPIRARIRGAVAGGRTKREVGRVQQKRKLLGHRPVFAGTRVPVDAVVEYLEDGYDDEAILKAFPRLTAADIDLARERAAAL